MPKRLASHLTTSYRLSGHRLATPKTAAASQGALPTPPRASLPSQSYCYCHSVAYGEAIVDAIHSIMILVLVFSSKSTASPHIPRGLKEPSARAWPRFGSHRRRIARQIPRLLHR